MSESHKKSHPDVSARPKQFIFLCAVLFLALSWALFHLIYIEEIPHHPQFSWEEVLTRSMLFLAICMGVLGGLLVLMSLPWTAAVIDRVNRWLSQDGSRVLSSGGNSNMLQPLIAISIAIAFGTTIHNPVGLPSDRAITPHSDIVVSLEMHQEALQSLAALDQRLVDATTTLIERESTVPNQHYPQALIDSHERIASSTEELVALVESTSPTSALDGSGIQESLTSIAQSMNRLSSDEGILGRRLGTLTAAVETQNRLDRERGLVQLQEASVALMHLHQVLLREQRRIDYRMLGLRGRIGHDMGSDVAPETRDRLKSALDEIDYLRTMLRRSTVEIEQLLPVEDVSRKR